MVLSVKYLSLCLVVVSNYWYYYDWHTSHIMLHLYCLTLTTTKANKSTQIWLCYLGYVNSQHVANLSNIVAFGSDNRCIQHPQVLLLSPSGEKTHHVGRVRIKPRNDNNLCYESIVTFVLPRIISTLEVRQLLSGQSCSLDGGKACNLHVSSLIIGVILDQNS